MARDRSKDEILDQMMYAIQCVTRHYGEGLSPYGLKKIRDCLAEKNWCCDAEWRVDILEGPNEPPVDFCPAVIPDGYLGSFLDEVAEESRTGEYDD